MRILVNASNLSGGGGVQVANSICMSLNRYSNHYFIVVASNPLTRTIERIKEYSNVELRCFDYPVRDFKSLVTGRNSFLDSMVKNNNIECVLTIFGPMKWNPKCKHVSGFALSQLVMPESPYFKRMGFLEQIRSLRFNILNKFIFSRGRKCYYTENSFITERVKKILHSDNVYTITNYYNQVFDEPNRWKDKKLSEFRGEQLLVVTSNAPHKNLQIIVEIAKILFEEYREINIRFVITVEEHCFKLLPRELKPYFNFIGKVDITECPSLYKQCNYSFQPTLLECFTATYPEAMRMGLPIITTDLEFARGLCGDAALYYDALNPRAAVEAIIRLIKDTRLRSELIKKGKEQLKLFDNYYERVDKIIKLCENYSDNVKN